MIQRKWNCYIRNWQRFRFGAKSRELFDIKLVSKKWRKKKVVKNQNLRKLSMGKWSLIFLWLIRLCDFKWNRFVSRNLMMVIVTVPFVFQFLFSSCSFHQLRRNGCLRSSVAAQKFIWKWLKSYSNGKKTQRSKQISVGARSVVREFRRMDNEIENWC